jgi:hypothetical protein
MLNERGVRYDLSIIVRDILKPLPVQLSEELAGKGATLLVAGTLKLIAGSDGNAGDSFVLMLLRTQALPTLVVTPHCK